MGFDRVRDVRSETYDAQIDADRVIEVPSNSKVRTAYGTNGKEKYIGYASRGTAEDESGWTIYYVQYDANNKFISRDVAYDSWANRESADYA